MAIDKSLNFKRRVGLKGGTDASQFEVKRSEQKTPNVSAGGASFNTLGPEPNYERGQNQFIDTLNKNNARRFEPSFTQRTYKPVTLNTVGARNQLPKIGGGIARLISFALGIPNMSGLTSLGDKLGDFREKTTGYRTQEEYDNARQQRINLGRINTLQNTLDRKYSDGDYSNTDLDERLAGLRSQMGIVPNNPEQNAQQFLNFGNELAENTQQTIFPAPTQDFNALYKVPDVSSSNLTSLIPQSGINTLEPAYRNPYNQIPLSNSIDTQVTPSREYPFVPFNNASVDASTNTNEELLRQLLNTEDTGIDNFIDQKNESENRQQELLNAILTG